MDDELKNVVYQKQLERSMNDWNVFDEFKNLSLDELQTIQKKNSLPYAIALVNIDGGLNIGTIIRSAVVFGCTKVFIIGKKKYDKRSTVGAHNYIEIVHIEENPIEYPHIAMYDIAMDYLPVMIETGGQDIFCENFRFWDIPPCFIFGSESVGIPSGIMDMVKQHNFKHLSLYQIGVLRSLNVAAAASIVMWKASSDLR